MQKEKIYKKFEELDKAAALGGGAVRIDKQHETGRMTARERIDMLLDKGTFVELDKFVTHRCTNFGMEKNKIPGDGIVSGYGKIEGRQVFVYAYDFTAYGGPDTGSKERCTGDCPERFGRCAHPGRGRQSGWLCIDLLSKYDGFRGGTPDFGYPRSLCRRSLLLAGIDRFHLYGEREEPYVHNRTGCREGRYA